MPNYPFSHRHRYYTIFLVCGNVWVMNDKCLATSVIRTTTTIHNRVSGSQSIPSRPFPNKGVRTVLSLLHPSRVARALVSGVRENHDKIGKNRDRNRCGGLSSGGS